MPGPLFRIPIPVPGKPWAPPPTFGAATGALISRRKYTTSTKTSKSTTIIVAAVAAGLVLLIAIVIITRTLRSRHPNPKYIPTPFLKRLWSDWKVPAYKPRHAYEPTSASAADDDMSRRRTRESAEDGPTTAETRNTSTTATTATPAAGVDRNTSVRSVMTLPVYRPRAAETEQVIGREGERDGIDVVVEMPTAEDEEALREEEMNALYQIRLTRRQQIAEREERRRLRREARETNNVVALQELRQQTRGSAERNNEVIEELRAEHERIRETRNRAVSSVSYADVGVARADGTRIRANSTESERVGLLSDVASIGQRTTGTGAGSDLLHRRDRSSSSIISIDTARSNDLAPESPSILTGGSTFSLASSVGGGRGVFPRSQNNSGINTPRAGSSPEMIDSFEDGDLGDTNMPPPDYDEVSLDDSRNHSRTDVSAAQHSGRNSPYDEPPPDYPGGPARIRNHRLSARMEDLAISQLSAARSRGNSPLPSPALPSTPSRAAAAPPTLPALGRLPQIVIDPSTR